MNKQLYTIFIVIGSCFAAFSEAEAQCTCANGTQPDSIVYNFTLPATSNFNSAITFPKFNPALGTMTCVNLVSHVSAVSNLSIRNLDSAQNDYAFLYTQAIGFSGPGGLSTLANTSLYYGPTTLDPYNNGVDSVHYGPDTPFKNFGLSKTTTNVAPYLGSGNVTINFTNTGSTLLLQGSNNYQSIVSTYAWGDFKLTYFWCASVQLALDIRNFSAIRKDGDVLLQWLSVNETANTRHEIQVSTDGRGFSSIQGTPKRMAGDNQSASYDYRYQPANGYTGKLFFRIKQIKSTGQYSYSPVKLVDLSSISNESVTIYPNPIMRNVSVGFKTPQTGDVKIEIVNTIGQSIYSKVETLAHQSKVDIALAKNAQPGAYFLRIRNLKTNEQMTQKIFLQ